MTIDKLEQLINEGVDMNFYLLLLNLEEANKSNHPKIKGWINILNKKGYILGDILTDKAVMLINKIKGNITEETEKEEKGAMDFKSISDDLHTKLQEKLKELTGKTQKRDKINGKEYSFLCGKVDFANKLASFIRQYKITDIKKIENVLINYIISCHNNKCFFPLIEYYIMKGGSSKLATDIDNYKDEIENTIYNSVDI